MNIVHITPGAGGMYCGGCFRDNALVRALRQVGHKTLMVPLYLPLTLEEEDQSAGTPIFFGGINVYLQQKSSFFRTAPRWVRHFLDSPTLLKWAAGSAAKTRAEQVGDLTVSMLRGEEGHQARELDELIQWLRPQPRPDVFCLSNALLIGLARRLKRDLRAPIVCLLAGEDTFLDSLPAPHRQAAWDVIAERAAEVDLFVAPSVYFADLMRERLRLPPERVRVIHNGINLEGYSPAPAPPDPPVLGYFSRMCREKGLDRLVEAFMLIKERGRVKNLKLRVGGGLSPTDEQKVVNPLRDELKARGLIGDVEFHPNLNRSAKQAFLRSLSVFSAPALYGEAFGLYVVEALAAGVPVVQPRHAAFPELVEKTGGGLITDSTPAALADGIETLLLDPARARALGETGRQSVLQQFSIERMAMDMGNLYCNLEPPRQREAPPVLPKR